MFCGLGMRKSVLEVTVLGADIRQSKIIKQVHI